MLEHVPWAWVQQLHRSFRRTFFTRPRPTGEYARVERDLDNIETVLGVRSFAPNWEFSYNKRGEDLNLARVVYANVTHGPGGCIRWWQYHVRGYPAPNGCVDLGCHWEPEPTEYPSEHLDGVGFSRRRGMMKLTNVLDDAGVEYEMVRYEPEDL